MGGTQEGDLPLAGRRGSAGRRLAAALSAPLLLVGMLGTVVLGPVAPAGATVAAVTGVDISYPQCSGSTVGSLPASVGFAVVGVNGGIPGTQNQCLQSELSWAAGAAGGQGVAPVSLYLNTSDPGNVYGGTVIADWPASGETPYGACQPTTATAGTATVTVGENSTACAFEFGEQKALQSFSFAATAIAAANTGLPSASSTRLAAAGSMPWWLDVETANTWQAGSAGLAMNVADIQGVIAGLRSAGVTAAVGVYANGGDWQTIAGGAALGAGVPDWVTGSSTEAQASTACTSPGFSPGSPVLLSQFPGSAQLDGDVACPAPQPPGYRLVAADGGIFGYGDAHFAGSMGGTPLVAPIVGMASTLDGAGYWEVAADGGIFSFGDAHFGGSMGGTPLVAPIVGMAADPATGGYWEVAADGGIFSFNAPFYGSMGGQPLNAPIVGMAATADGGGYWLVASDGGIFSFGDARFAGSMGGHPLNQPIVGMAADPATGGYWEVAADGGIFSFNAPFYGSMGGRALVAPVVGIAASPDGGGYWEVAKDGGLFTFGDARFAGSMGGQPLVAPVVAMSSV